MDAKEIMSAFAKAGLPAPRHEIDKLKGDLVFLWGSNEAGSEGDCFELYYNEQWGFSGGGVNLDCLYCQIQFAGKHDLETVVLALAKFRWLIDSAVARRSSLLGKPED